MKSETSYSTAPIAHGLALLREYAIRDGYYPPSKHDAYTQAYYAVLDQQTEVKEFPDGTTRSVMREDLSKEEVTRQWEAFYKQWGHERGKPVIGPWCVAEKP